MIEDRELLRRYAHEGDEPSFRALAEKYTGLVFGCAYRRTGDRLLAEEATQNVFVALARKAGGLRVKRSLSRWLHRCAVLESSALLRAEGRHRRRVQAVVESSNHDANMNCSTESDLERADVAADIDEALDHLAPADREVVFLRYFEERSYDEIADRLGKSSEASRKRVSRSIAKLEKYFERRGTAASSVTVGAALSGALTMTPPPGLAAAASTSAITNAAELAPLVKTLTIIQTMALSKSGGLAIGVAFCILCGTGGYVAGKAKANQRASDLQFLSSIGNDGRGGESDPEDPSSPRTATAASPSALEILERAAALFRSSANNAEAYQEGVAELARLKSADVPEALRFMNGLLGETLVWEAMLFGVLNRWAQTEPGEALVYANQVVDGGALAGRVFGSLAAVWARKDADAAMEWFRQNKIPADVSHQHIRDQLYSGWAQSDAAAAVASLDLLPNREASEVAESIAALVGKDLNREPILAAVAHLKKPQLRSRAVKYALEEWGRYEPEDAGAWFDTVEFENEEQRAQAASGLAGTWMDQDVTAALDWFWPRVGEGEMREEVVEFIEQWQQEDPDAAKAWIEKTDFNW